MLQRQGPVVGNEGGDDPGRDPPADQARPGENGEEGYGVYEVLLTGRFRYMCAVVFLELAAPFGRSSYE